MNNSELKNEFKNFLIEHGYKIKTNRGNKSTVYDYPKRIDFVCEKEGCSWEKLAENLDSIIQEYSPNGVKSEFGARSHYAVIYALKKYLY